MCCSGTHTQHAQQAGSDLQQQGSSSIGYASPDSQATEYAVADALTAGNSNSTATPAVPDQQGSLVSKVVDALTSGNSNSTTTSAVPDQQDSLVSKVVGKLMPSALASKLSGDSEEADGAEGHQGAYYGGVLDAAGNQTMNDSTGGSLNQSHECTVPALMHALLQAQRAQQIQNNRTGVQSRFACCAFCVCLTALHAILMKHVLQLLWQCLASHVCTSACFVCPAYCHFKTRCYRSLYSLLCCLLETCTAWHTLEFVRAQDVS